MYRSHRREPTKGNNQRVRKNTRKPQEEGFKDVQNDADRVSKKRTIKYPFTFLHINNYLLNFTKAFKY